MYRRNSRHQVLIIGSYRTEAELRPILNRYGYSVVHSRARLDGARMFRSRKPAIVILDVEALRGNLGRLFRFFRMVRENVLILIAADSQHQADATAYLLRGAHDVIYFPLDREAL